MNNSLLMQENIIDSIRNFDSSSLIIHLDAMNEADYFFIIDEKHYHNIENCFKKSKNIIINILLLYFKNDKFLIRYITEMSLLYKDFACISYILYNCFELVDIDKLMTKSIEYNFTKLGLYILDNYTIDKSNTIFFSFLCKNYTIFKKLLSRETFHLYNHYFIKYCYINNHYFLLIKLSKYYTKKELIDIIPDKTLLFLKIF